MKGRKHGKGRDVRRRRRKGGKRITDSKGEKPSVSELCLHS